jgi:predicted PurR-regulated permease PerM
VEDFKAHPSMELLVPELDNLLMLRLRHLATRPNNPAQDELSSGPNDSLPFYRGGPQRFGRMALALGLSLLATWMLWSILPAIAWAGVLAIATWPLYSIGQRHLGQTWAAAALVIATALILLLPMLIIGMELAREAGAVVQWAQSIVGSKATPPAWLSNLPLIGTRLASWWRTSIAGSPNTADLSARLDFPAIVEWARTFGSEVAWRLITFVLALLILFFIYRDGDKFIEQVTTISDRLFGRAGRRLGARMVATVRETVNGQLFVGLGEGFVLGMAYAVCGLPHPLLLGALTVVLAIIPFGAPLLVAAASLILVIQSNTIQAFGLLAFGSFVFLAEYFVRPLLIGSSARLSFIWVLLGIFGGLSAFGLIGLFLGPAILAALIALWRELAAPSSA